MKALLPRQTTDRKGELNSRPVKFCKTLTIHRTTEDYDVPKNLQFNVSSGAMFLFDESLQQRRKVYSSDTLKTLPADRISLVCSKYDLKVAYYAKVTLPR